MNSRCTARYRCTRSSPNSLRYAPQASCDRVKMLMLTNCTFDGIVYDVGRVMEECLAIKPGSGVPVGRGVVRLRPLPSCVSPAHRNGGGQHACRQAAARLSTGRSTRRACRAMKAAAAMRSQRLIPDPARARVRVYSTHSTHKTLTALRQGSMIHVYDQDFALKVAEGFHEAYMSHTSTSPIIRSWPLLILVAGRPHWKASSWCNGSSSTR